jgi:hypothetical protein
MLSERVDPATIGNEVMAVLLGLSATRASPACAYSTPIR